jgi:hypothetical protein
MQIKFNMPADGWPTSELLTRLRGTPSSAAPALPSPFQRN